MVGRVVLHHDPLYSNQAVTRDECRAYLVWQHCFSPVFLTNLLSPSWRRGESNDTPLLITRNLLKKRDAQNAITALRPIPMYKIMYNEIRRCRVAHRLSCYENYCTCTLASSALLSAVSLARAQFSGKRAQALFCRYVLRCAFWDC
jgi:hypothetical protein